MKASTWFRDDRLAWSRTRVPPQLAIGLLLVAVAWPTAWFGSSVQSEFTFFPIWLGYVLSVDGIVLLRSGSSLMNRSRSQFIGIFVASIPLWWLFELANYFLDNWTYIVPHQFGFVVEHLGATLSFSTVIPAVFETAEFLATTRIGREWRAIKISPSDRQLVVISALGFSAFFLSLAFPDYFFPLVWLGLFFGIDPINGLFGYPSIAKQVANNRWDTVFILFAAGLMCGFFWEMWNYWSAMKWVYNIDHVDQLRLFEMPALGYGGYLPFALEVYAIYHFLHLIIRKPERGYLRFDKAARDVVDPRFGPNL